MKVKIDKIVLVAVIKNRRDLNILLTKNWYRIPAAYATNRQFDYLAFYEPALFGEEGKCIQYYARVLNHQTTKRRELLPDELNHPRVNNDYLLLQLDKIKKLPCPIRNIRPRRVSFAFTTLNHLLESKTVLQLYKVAPTEEIMEAGLRRAGLKTISQHYVLAGKKRYCLDFAVFCKQGAIAIECDNKKAHSGAAQRKKDEIKNAALRRSGWTVIRFREEDIISDLKGCLVRIKKATQKLGGVKREQGVRKASFKQTA